MLVTGTWVAAWTAMKLGYYPEMLGQAQGIGWAQGQTFIRETMLMGVLFNHYTERDLHVHFYKEEGVMVPPMFLAAVMDYPFNQAKVRRITAPIPAKNLRMQALARRLGFVCEGQQQEMLDNDDLMLYGLTSTQAKRWLTAPIRRHLGVEYGQHLQPT